jgi:hypothetical protein
MRLFRYRNPSVKTMLGITKAKKRFNNAVGITALKRVPTLLDQGIVRFPSRCPEHSDDIGSLVMSCPGINHQKGTFPTHTISPRDAT